MSKILGDIITKIMSKKLSENGELFRNIFINWSKIVGSNISKYATPIKIIYESDIEPTLYINAFNSAASMDINLNQELILERIATYYGYRAVKKLKIFTTYR